MGIIERKGRIKAGVIPTPSKVVLLKKLKENVAHDVKSVAIDQYQAYKSLGKIFPHQSANQGHLKFVRGEVNTNSVENSGAYWSADWWAASIR